mgnify:CR=1 FL=1
MFVNYSSVQSKCVRIIQSNITKTTPKYFQKGGDAPCAPVLGLRLINRYVALVKIEKIDSSLFNDIHTIHVVKE